MDIVKKEMLEIKRKYKSERRTQIVESEEKINVKRADVKRIVSRWALGITGYNTLKFLEYDDFMPAAKKKLSINAPTYLMYKHYVYCDTAAPVYIFTNLGNCVRINLDEVEPTEFRASGVRIENIADGATKGEYPVAIFAGQREGEALFFTKQGAVKRTEWGEYDLNKRFFPAIKLKDRDEVVAVESFDPDEFSTMLFVTKNAMCLCAQKDDVPVQGRIAGGVKGVGLNSGDEVVFATQQNGEGEIIVATTLGGFKRVISSLFDPHGRGSKGVMIADIKGKGEILFADYVTVPYTLAVVDNDRRVTEVDTESINIESRVFKGKPIKGINGVYKVVALKYKTAYEDGVMQMKF